MNEADKGKICLGALLFTPLVTWFIAAKTLYGFTPKDARERLVLLCLLYTSDAADEL